MTVPGVDHAFVNDTGQRFSLAGATDAYRRTLGWFGQHLV